MAIKSCWECKHLNYESGSEGSRGYSEFTPGTEGCLPILECRLKHFEVDFANDSDTQFRTKILSAETCTDFVDFKER